MAADAGKGGIMKLTVRNIIAELNKNYLKCPMCGGEAEICAYANCEVLQVKIFCDGCGASADFVEFLVELEQSSASSPEEPEDVVNLQNLVDPMSPDVEHKPNTDLIKLDNIQRRNGNIKAFILPNNFVEANTGKDGWGRLTVAVDNATVADFFSDSVIGVLYVVSREDWAKEGAAK